MPAAKIEAAIVDAVRGHLGPDAPVDDAELITAEVRHIEVRRREIAISLADEDDAGDTVLTVPCHGEWQCDVEWTDAEFDPGRPNVYYARVVQVDRESAWSSPIWVG